MSKINIGNQAFMCPMPVVLVGTTVGESANFMTVGWISRVNYKPALVGAAISKGHFTSKGILETGAFSVNVPSADMAEVTDYCGLVSGKKTDKAKRFTLFYGELKTVPMIEECPLTMECKLYQTVDLPTNYLFLGEIVATYCEEACLGDGNPDIEKISPLTLTMPDNRYWRAGGYVGDAWSMGKKLKE